MGFDNNSRAVLQLLQHILISRSTNPILQIVDEQNVQAKLDVPSSKTFVLKADWFWYTIQNGYADETDYLFEQVSVIVLWLLC